jgi:hypothetical protein
VEKDAASESVVYKDPTDIDVTVSEERWRHIVSSHPEMLPHRADLGQTIEQPKVVYERGLDRYYFREVMSERFGSMFLHARAIPKPNYFVVTAWLMPRIQMPRGAVQIWPSQLP